MNLLASSKYTNKYIQEAMNDVIATNTVDLNAQSVPRENNYSLSLSRYVSLGNTKRNRKVVNSIAIEAFNNNFLQEMNL